MEEVRERLLDVRDWFLDRFDDIRDFLADNPNVRRWIVEGCICLAVGILAGVITFNVLNHEKKTLAVKEENAATPVQEQTAEGSEDISAASSGEAPAQDYGDVVIEVVDPGEYVGDIANWSQAEIDAAVSERSNSLNDTSYWPAVESYWASRGVSGNARFCTYLFDTSNKVYSAEDFAGLSPEVIHVVKNEMYARHGYSFRDANLMNYFMGQIWYSPSVMPADFSEEIFTETEVKNLDLLNSLDKM
ncbi:MAG: YARHG domain-containing protein [Pseudobutyrivibrio sp.]|nr:YARHG domain-containing protein [Pseudobutyrivibrio sp.]